MEKDYHRDTRLPGAFDLFNPSGKAFALNWWPFVAGWLTPIILLIVPVIIFFGFHFQESANGTLQNSGPSAGAAVNILAIILGILAIASMLIFYGSYMTLLKYQSARGVKTTYRANFKQCLHYFWRVLGLYIVRNFIIFLGFLLLIVPGLFIWRRWMLAPFYLIDEDGKVFESLDKSAADSKPFSKSIWGMTAVYIVLAVISWVVPFIGGVISTIGSVVYCCAQAIRYLQIKAVKAI
ncbi:MAG TPA: hypothetical protein VFP35_03435 [Candidatus Saccharimonadales bacterium]|nr:hypothetical protein [Candidatus Saccharimonadales bacterium]